MKQQDKRAIWLVLAGVGMAAAAFFMYMAAERLSKSGMDGKREAKPPTEAGQTSSPAPAPVAVKPIVQPTPSFPEEPAPQIEPPSEPPPARYVYVEDPIEKAARDYDANGQIGNPPPGWKDDYSHWDSENWGIPVEKLGTPYPDGEMNYAYRPVRLTSEGQRRLDEIIEKTRQTKGEAAAEALISKEWKSGGVIMMDGSVREASYSHAQLENGDVVYVGVNVYDLDGFTDFGNQARRFSSPNNFSISYYRRRPDGALVREVISPSSSLKDYVAAAPPDMSTYTDAQIEAMKDSWLVAIATVYGCYE